MSDLFGARIIILGLGREGLSSYRFLREQFPEQELTLADQSPTDILLANFPEWKEISRLDQKLVWQIGDHYLENLANFDFLIKTAGIPITLPAIQAALELNPSLQITSNMQLFFDRCQGSIIGITGSKGKSTTSQLIFDILSQSGRKTVFLGNIGRPALNYLSIIDQDTLVVAELSSHQLAELKASPQVAVLLDVTPEHLDYFANFEQYYASKTAITRYQSANDWLVYNPQLNGAKQLAKLSAVRSDHRVKHSLEDESDKANIDVFIKNEEIYWREKDKAGQLLKLMPVKEVKLLGKHNLYNVLSAIAVAKIFQVKPASLQESISNFKGLAHRLEFIAEINGVKYFDDSVATNPTASSAAIRSFPQEKVILLAGGSDKKLDLSEYLTSIIEQKVKALLLFPPIGEKILQKLQELWQKRGLLMTTFPKYQLCHSMSEAVELASNWAKTGDVVLLSPACASFGLFKDYQDRGQQFQLAVNNLLKD
ncbi:MAG: UDP-N-acetylmuramoyl-L-alanine--D-glutamate ligase [Candidatus Pacebacteria bacterium]|jgi:UDP-N-acetylmuramoylalanine--D-glutamate ligase|nr:UDP-N-acetylmuramoyl-L-alanine--D-glutamate ligase [Candidatus Paceibacterota bacterium]